MTADFWATAQQIMCEIRREEAAKRFLNRKINRDGQVSASDIVAFLIRREPDLNAEYARTLAIATLEAPPRHRRPRRAANNDKGGAP